MIKLKVREKSLSFASAKKRNTVHKEQNLEDKNTLLEKELEQPSASELQKTNIKEQLDICKSELEEIIMRRTQGAILRCKIIWYNEGEKNTKYFLNLERHFKLSTINQLKINEHEFVTSDSKILAECETFYKELYTTNKKAIPAESEFFQLENDTVLDNNEAEGCEGPLTEKECLEALESMDHGKNTRV